jgi:hypothetical protein
VKDLQVAFLALSKKGEFGGFALQKGFSFAVKNNAEEKMIDAKSLLVAG